MLFLLFREKPKAYHVYVKQKGGAPDIVLAEERPDASVFVLQGLWAFAHGMPVLGVGVIGCLAAISYAIGWVSENYDGRVSAGMFFWLYVLLLGLVYAYGSGWKRFTLEKKGYVDLGMVCGGTEAKAYEYVLDQLRRESAAAP